MSNTAPPIREPRGRVRRRSRPGPVFDTTIASPCISVCQIDDTTGCCLGCHRSMDEIRDWPIMTAAEKTAVLARVAERKGAEAICGSGPRKQDRDD